MIKKENKSQVVRQVTTRSEPVLLVNRSLSVGEQVQCLRALKGVSQKQLSEISGLHISKIRNLENDNGSCRIDDLQKAMRALNGVVICTYSPFGYVPPKEEKDLGMVFDIPTRKKEDTIFPLPFVPTDNNKI